MKKIAFNFCIFLCLGFTIPAESSIFSPAVKCRKDKASATCLLSNETTKVMNCELLIVGETKGGTLLSSSQKDLIMPFEKQEIALKNAGAENILHASAEAVCHYL